MRPRPAAVLLVLAVTLAVPASAEVRPVSASEVPVPATAGSGVRGEGHASVARWPVDGPVLRVFDPPATPYGAGHRGVDLAAEPGTPVRAALPGVVTFSGEVARRGWVTVAHGGGLDTTYGWIDPRSVTRGERVREGQVLGRLAGDAAHLDWGARIDGEYVDPLGLLGPWRATLVPLGRRQHVSWREVRALPGPTPVPAPRRAQHLTARPRDQRSPG
jgi:murein DD-endopeptidase MepM/ murein hydrolase activator NlpD